MMIEGADYIVRPVSWLTGDLPAVTSIDENGFYSIFVNDRLAPLAQREAVEHELVHINRDDFFNNLPIQAIEGATPIPDRPGTTDPDIIIRYVISALAQQLLDEAAARAKEEAERRDAANQWVQEMFARIAARNRPKKLHYRTDDDPDLPDAL